MSLADQQWCPTSVQVTVLQARGLRIKGKSGTNDAYAVMQVGKEKYQTSVVEKSVAPVWKEEAAFDLPPQPLQGGGGGGGGGGERGTLHVHVLHRALVGPDKLLGQAVINLLQLSEDETRNKTEWFKLLDKTGKADKDRGQVLLDIQFMRNNMTASMFDLSTAGKPRSRLGKFKDKVRGKKKESDAVSNLVPSFTQVLTDSEEEAHVDGEVTSGKDEKKKKHKIKSLFSPKSNLQNNMSQSMSVLPGKNSSLSGSQSSGLNVESSEGKKKFKFMIHKRSGSSDSKDSSVSHKNHGATEQSNLCINGSHVYCEEPQTRASRIGSNFSLASSGHGSMEEVPESSLPSIDSLRAVRQYSPWMEEEDMAEAENIKEDVDEEEEEERIKMEEQIKTRRQEDLKKLAEEKRKQEEEEKRIEERVKRKEAERIQREEERKRQEEEERVRKEDQEKLAEQKRTLEKQERRIKEEKRQREEEESIRMEKERAQEQQRKQEEEEKVRREEERKLAEEKRRLKEEERRLAEEKARKEEERAEEERRRQEEEERVRRREEEREIKKRLEEQKRSQKEEEERRHKEEERARKEKEECERIVEEKRKLEEESKRIKAEENVKREEEEMIRRDDERRREEAEQEKRRLDEKRQKEERERIKKEEERSREEQERARKEKEEYERVEEKKRQEEQEKRQKEEEELIRKREQERIRMEEEERRREEKVKKARREEEEQEQMRRLEEQERKRAEEEKRQREEQERIKKEEERRREEEERARKEKEEYERVEEKKKQEEQEKRQKEEAELIRKREQERVRMEEEERARKEKEEYERLEEKKRQEEQERRQKQELFIKREQERIRMEEEKRRHEEEERIRREREEMKRLAEEKRRLEEQEKRRTEEEEKNGRAEVQKAEGERKENEARKLREKEKLTDAKKPKERDNGSKGGHPVGRTSTVAEESPADVPSTNLFDDSYNPFEEDPDSSVGPNSSTTKVSNVQLRCQASVSQVEIETISNDEKNLICAQREKRLAPQPPGRNQAESHRDTDVSTRHLVQINKQSDDRDIKTASVLPQRSVKMMAPVSRSPTDAKSTQSLMQSSTTKGTTSLPKQGKRPAPPRPGSMEEEPSSEAKTAIASVGDTSGGRSEVKAVQVVYGLNPFEDEEDENEAQISTSGNTGSICWSPDVSLTASQTKIKSSKVARAPPPPAGVSITENSATELCASESEAIISVQERPLRESQEHSMMEEAGGKQDMHPATSRRLQPVKPLNPLEQQPVSINKGETGNRSTRIHGEVQDKTKVNDTRLKGPYSQLTQEELIALVLKQEKQLKEKDKKISELEQYIDNLLVRVMEEKPSILMSLSSMKKAV